MIRFAYISSFVLYALIMTSVPGVIPAQAADLYVKPKSYESKQQPASPNEEVLELLDEAPPVEEPQPEPKTINDFSNAFYRNCLKQQHPLLKEDGLKMMCACTAAQIPATMSVENMRAMQNNDAEGKLQRSRMIMFVYTPCIEYPTKALILDQCLGNEEIRSTMKNHQKVCECLGENMGKFMREEAPKYVQKALRRNPDNLDPLGMMLQSPLYDERSRHFMQRCVYKHVLSRQ